jgi:hypothetical protein
LRFVFDEKAAEAVLGPETGRGVERSPALAEGDDVVGVLDGEDLAVTPERFLAGAERFLGERFRGGDEIVVREERFAAGSADVLGNGGVVLFGAGGAGEVREVHAAGAKARERSGAIFSRKNSLAAASEQDGLNSRFSRSVILGST